jgi:dethiobiotin synthetase
MTKGVFITGTDTGIGKTCVARLLVRELKERDYRCAAMKPVASGATLVNGQLCNDDALQLIKESGLDLSYPVVNPYVFEPPIAPHIAAEQTQTQIDLDEIESCYQALAKQADWVVVEGVGGWCVPLGPDYTTADLAVQLKLPVVLVVGLRLGCLNHALLTAAHIDACGGQLLGWVANSVDPGFDFMERNITSLRERLPAPLLGRLTYSGHDVLGVNRHALDLQTLLDGC